MLTDEISPMHCPDFQHEGSPCKIFTCCHEVNKRPLLACWDQSKVWAKDMKAYDSMWSVGVGGAVVFMFACVYVYICLCECSFSTRVNVCAENQRACMCLRTVCVVNLHQKRHEHRVAPCWSQGPRASAATFVPVKWREHGNFKKNCYSAIINMKTCPSGNI